MAALLRRSGKRAKKHSGVDSRRSSCWRTAHLQAALNRFTVQLAHEFRDGSVVIDAVNPGYTATDLNQNRGTQTVEEGSAEIVRVALLDLPVTGKYLETAEEIPW